MSHGRAQPRHRRRKSDFFGSPAKQSIDAPPPAAPEAADDEWVRCHDAATGASYYANRRSFEVSWTPPPAVAASAPAPPPVVVTAKASVAAPPPARARRAADAAWIGRGGAALAKATREAPTPAFATPVVAPSPPTPEPPTPPVPEAENALNAIRYGGDVALRGQAFAASVQADLVPAVAGDRRVAPSRPIHIVFDATGGAEPAEVELSREGQVVFVRVDAAGEVTVDG